MATAPRSILDIDVRDEKFKAFLALYDQYQKDLAGMKGLWVDTEKAIEGAADAASKVGEATADIGEKTEAATKTSESMAAVIAAIAASTTLITEHKTRQSDADKAAAKAAGEQRDTERESLKIQQEKEKSSEEHQKRLKEFYQDSIGLTATVARNVFAITEKVAKWAILSLGAGLIGGGAGLFGIDRLGEDVASTRRQAQGFGISAGELQAFNVNFGERLGLGADFLGSVQDIKSDLGKQWQFTAMGIPAQRWQTEDDAALSTDVIKRAHEMWREAGPQGHNHQWMEAHGLSSMSLNQWQAIGAQSPGDINRWSAQYQRDARTMGASDPVQKEWVDFITQLHRAGEQIQKIFVEGLEPLVRSDALPKLSAAVEHVLAGFLGNPHMKEWIDDFAKGISVFGDYLGSEKFETDVKGFVDGIAYAADRIGNILQALGIIAPTANRQAVQALPSIYANREQIMQGLHGAALQPGQDMDFTGLEQKTGLPPGLLRAIGMQESRLNPNVATTWDGTPKQAHEGIFQQSTDFQKQFGITSPPSPEEAAKGEAIALQNYMQKFKGNLAEVIAAQNEGPTGVDRQIEEARRKGGDWFTYAPAGVKKYVNEVAHRMNISVSVLNQTGANIAITANAVRQ
jgi:hypothetical protein